MLAAGINGCGRIEIIILYAGTIMPRYMKPPIRTLAVAELVMEAVDDGIERGTTYDR